MKNLAEWKRELKVGSEWVLICTLYGKCFEERKVLKVTSNKIKWENGSVYYFGKASCFKFHGDGQVDAHSEVEPERIVVSYIKKA